jgi:hypothetical protein
MKTIEKLYCWIGTDAYHEEGICGWWDEANNGWLMLVHPDKARAEGYRSMALQICNDGQFPVRLVEFTIGETLEKHP